MMKNWKLICTSICLSGLMMIVSCGPDFVPAFDSEEQLAIDIELIEAYLADKGYVDYDTLDSDIRMVVIDEGDGSSLEFNDIVSFNYIGIFLNDTIFDTSIEQIAYDQDLINTIDTTFQTNSDGSFKTDDQGNKIVQTINYSLGYVPIYSSSRSYQPFKTTHTVGGWYTYQLFPSGSSGYIAGFAPSIVYTLFNSNLNGRVLALIPSGLAYGSSTSISKRLRNKVLMFEFRLSYKR